jgi:uncharacterized protein YjcR
MPMKRGGQPGNTNAVKHGRFSKATREAHPQAVAAREARSREWMAAAPKVDYGRVLDELARLQREAAAATS